MDTDPNTLALEAAAELKSRKNPQALTILYEHYFSRVYNYIRYRCDDQPSSTLFLVSLADLGVRKVMIGDATVPKLRYPSFRL